MATAGSASTAVPPSPTMSTTALSMVTNGMAMVVAATPAGPSACPTNIPSTRMYSRVTTSPVTTGTAKRAMSAPTGSVPMRASEARARPATSLLVPGTSISPRLPAAIR